MLGFIDPAQKELQQRLQNSGGKCQAFTLTQIKQATENFKTTIGIGGFGEVYYGKLVNGQEIAVKTLSTFSHQTEQEFFNEVTKFYNLKFFYVKSSKKLSRFICPCLLCQMNSYVIFTIGSSDLFLADWALVYGASQISCLTCWLLPRSKTFNACLWIREWRWLTKKIAW